MGFDPRQWRPPAGGRPVTANLESLLAENDALRRELRVLREQLEQLGAQRQAAGSRVSNGVTPGLSGERVEQWIAAMGRHRRWAELRIGPPGGLRGLVDDLRRHWWNPALSLEQELDRRSPGLGGELAVALRGPHSRGRWAVRAAFALYGPRATEWLSEDPMRVVAELCLRLERLERREGGHQHRRGTRTENHTGAGSNRNGDAGSNRSHEGSQRSGQGGSRRGDEGGSSRSGEAGSSRSGQGRRAAAPGDPIRQALALLGLEPGATPQAIKRAYRRLAKTHHPDLGGDPQAFHRLDAAYRLLLG